MKTCGICGQENKSLYGKKFCGSKCNAENARRIGIEKFVPLPPKLCKRCGEVITGDRRNDFCTQSCSAISNNLQRGFEARDRRGKCPCGSNLVDNQLKYCNRKCWTVYRPQELIAMWKSGEWDGVTSGDAVSATIRQYIIAKFGNKCTGCGWCEINPTTGKVPVTLHHLDGNPRNNVEENLTVMCPNCHSLTPTYGGLNRGNGRRNRRRSVHDKVISQ